MRKFSAVVDGIGVPNEPGFAGLSLLLQFHVWIGAMRLSKVPRMSSCPPEALTCMVWAFPVLPK